MKQKLKRFMAGFMAVLTMVMTLFTNESTAFAASPQANIAFWYASTKNSGEVSELKAGYNHGKILYSILDGNSAYCMNFGLKADGGQLMNSYDETSTSMSAQQRKLLSYCLYYGFNSTQKAAPSNSQCDEYIATQAMVWVIVADIFGTGSGDSAARKLCNTAPSPDSSYSYYERLRDNISSSYNATVVNMSTYTDNYVNPLEMDVWSLDPNDSKGMVREKGEFMLGLCEQCIGDSLNSRQKSIIDRCVRKLYIDIARSKEKYIPVMSDFYDILMAQPEDEAKDIALSLELFVNGSLNIFNHQTNVDVDNRFTVYGIRDLGTELSPITMLVMMESIQNRIVENGKRGKATWLYIDEFHVLLNSEYSAKYLQQLWKKVRKQGGLCTGITQNVVDLLQNYTATTMLANSEFVALLKQANTDSSKMAEVIGVSEAQLRFVTNTASGMGLIKCGSVVIPFDNQISKDTDLYRLYNTNIHEKIAEQKKKEAMLQ